MKTLILVRHGKSSWKYDLPDRDRPLKSRGITDATLVSEKFKERNISPDRVISSPANRAFSTCKIFLQNLGISSKVLEINDEIYDFGGQNVIQFIKELDDAIHSVMIFGHNHAFTSIANSYGDKFIDNLPTSGLVKLNFDITNWNDLKQGTTEFIIIPKELRYND